MVNLSNSESRTLCKRVFSALGFPAGADTELADAVIWMASMRIVPLDFLADSLEKLVFTSTSIDRSQLTQINKHVTSDFDGSNLLSLLEVVDVVTAKAGQFEACHSVKIFGPRYIAAIIPLALARSHFDVSYKLSTLDFDIVIRKDKIWANKNLVGEGCLQKATEVHLTGALDELKISKRLFDLNNLERRLSKKKLRKLSMQRIDIDSIKFQKLKKKAAESFVPNSELSRRSGAGAEVDDND